RPGGNVTGVSFVSGLLGPKRLDMLRQLVPAAATTAVLVGTDTLEARIERRGGELAAQALRPEIIIAPLARRSHLRGQLRQPVALRRRCIQARCAAQRAKGLGR